MLLNQMQLSKEIWVNSCLAIYMKQVFLAHQKLSNNLKFCLNTYITNVYCPEIEERLVKHARNVTKYALLTWHVTHYEYFSIFKNWWKFPCFLNKWFEKLFAINFVVKRRVCKYDILFFIYLDCKYLTYLLSITTFHK